MTSILHHPFDGFAVHHKPKLITIAAIPPGVRKPWRGQSGRYKRSESFYGAEIEAKAKGRRRGLNRLITDTEEEKGIFLGKCGRGKETQKDKYIMLLISTYFPG